MLSVCWNCIKLHCTCIVRSQLCGESCLLDEELSAPSTMMYHLCIYTCGLLLVSQHASAVPTVNIDSVIPSASSTGIVHRKDSFAVEAILERPNTDDSNYMNDIYVETSEDGSSWSVITLTGCSFDLGSCTTTSTANCYCKAETVPNVNSKEYNIVFNYTALSSLSLHKIRFKWQHETDPFATIFSTSDTLPAVCDQINDPTEGETNTRLESPGNNTIQKPSGDTPLTFEVTNLVSPYTIKIQLDGVDKTSTTTGTSVTTTVTDADVGQVFTLSYNESAASPACGRSGSYDVVYSLIPDSTTSDAGRGGSHDIGIIIGVTLGVCACIIIIVVLFAKSSKATDVEVKIVGCTVTVSWIPAYFPCKKETVKIYKFVEHGEKKLFKSVDPDPRNASGKDSKKHIATVEITSFGEYTACVVTAKLCFNTESASKGFCMGEGQSRGDKPPEGQKLPPITPQDQDNHSPDRQGDETDGLAMTQRETEQHERKKKKKRSSPKKTTDEAEMETVTKGEETDQTKRKKEKRKSHEKTDEETDEAPRPLPSPRNLPPVRNPRPLPNPTNGGVNTSVSSPHGMETHFVTHSQSHIDKNRPTSIEVTNLGK